MQTPFTPKIAALFRPQCLAAVEETNRRAKIWMDMPEKELKKLLAQERRKKKEEEKRSLRKR